jgi:inner membrane protein
MLGKKLGKRALFLGAIAQSIPDIDFVASFWMDTASNLLAHRGFTHSLLCGLLLSFFLSIVSEYFHRKHDISLKRWFLFFGVEIGIHLFLDAFNNYGVGWFEPFSHYRISFNILFVADPFFSVWPFIAFLALVFLEKNHRHRKRWWIAAMAICALYLAYCTYNKASIDASVKQILSEKKVAYSQYLSTPTPLNNWLWYIAAGDSKGFYIGYRSVFEKRKDMTLEYFPRNAGLLDSLKDHEALLHLIRFSQGFYTVEIWNNRLVFNDLRFQQVAGWDDPKAKFVFHYFLQHPDDNKFVVQRDRFAKWNIATAKTLLKRITAP